MTIALAAVLGALWGLIWALALQTRPGRFIASRHTWLAVVIGVGGDLLVLLVALSLETWLAVSLVVAVSSAPIILRSLYNEWQDHIDLMGVLRGDQDSHR